MRDRQLVLTQSRELLAAARVTIADSRDHIARSQAFMAALRRPRQDAADARDVQRLAVGREE